MPIGEWWVDPTLDEISKDGTTVKLEPRIVRATGVGDRDPEG
jgi:hypothetical protein